jgi:hypothetical protein
MKYASTNIDLIQPDDNSAAIEAICEKIRGDGDLLHEAVYEERGAFYELAQLRIKLSYASWILGELSAGRDLDAILNDSSRMWQSAAFADLVRTADECAAYVDEKVLQAATDEVL